MGKTKTIFEMEKQGFLALAFPFFGGESYAEKEAGEGGKISNLFGQATSPLKLKE